MTRTAARPIVRGQHAAGPDPRPLRNCRVLDGGGGGCRLGFFAPDCIGLSKPRCVAVIESPRRRRARERIQAVTKAARKSNFERSKKGVRHPVVLARSKGAAASGSLFVSSVASAGACGRLNSRWIFHRMPQRARFLSSRANHKPDEPRPTHAPGGFPLGRDIFAHPMLTLYSV